MTEQISAQHSRESHRRILLIERSMHSAMPSTPSRASRSTRCGLFLVLSLTLTAGPARAGSITVESIISESVARQGALEQVPANATVERTHCQEIGMPGGSYRYRCTAEYRMPPLQPGVGAAGPDRQQPVQDQP